jgi:primosomal protein N'
MLSQTKNALFILVKKGLYGATFCKGCGYMFISPESDIPLTTIQDDHGKYMFIDNITQKTYDYPSVCPVCNKTAFSQKFGGKDKLDETIQVLTDVEKVLKKYHLVHEIPLKIHSSSRLFDPGLDYTKYSHLIILNFDGLFSGIDYLQSEETTSSLYKLYSSLSEETKIILDSSRLDGKAVKNMILLGNGEETLENYLQKSLEQEIILRKQLLLPPYSNILLFTVNDKNRSKALSDIKNYFELIRAKVVTFNEVCCLPPYPSKLMKRKGMYSYNFLIKFPRNYSNFQALRNNLLTFTLLQNLQIRLNPKHIF